MSPVKKPDFPVAFACLVVFIRLGPCRAVCWVLGTASSFCLLLASEQRSGEQSSGGEHHLLFLALRAEDALPRRF